MKKKLFALSLCVIMVLTMAISVSAAQPRGVSTPTPDNTYFIACWNGYLDSASNSKLLLTGNGINARMTTAPTNSRDIWWLLDAPHGDWYLRNSASASEVVNIYRVLESGSYYYCRGYWYESYGNDQRIKTSGSKIYLASPIMGGTWYLQADRSNPSISDVIFYTDGTRPQAQWEWIPVVLP